MPEKRDEKQITQSERFIKAAQELGTDDDPERFAERVRKLAKPPTQTQSVQPDYSTDKKVSPK